MLLHFERELGRVAVNFVLDFERVVDAAATCRRSANSTSTTGPITCTILPVFIAKEDAG